MLWVSQWKTTQNHSETNAEITIQVSMAYQFGKPDFSASALSKYKKKKTVKKEEMHKFKHWDL